MRKATSKSKVLKNKRGSAESTFFVIIIMLAFAFILVIGHLTYNQVAPEIKEKFSEEGQVSAEYNTTIYNTMENGESASNIYDYVFVTLFIALVIGLLISSFLVDVHPIFTLVYLIVAVLLVVIAFPLSNAWIEFSNTASTEVQASLLEFPMTSLLMERLPYIAIGLTLISMVILYSKSRRGGGL